MSLKLPTNTPVTACFPYGDFKPTNGKAGPHFLYTVEVDGQRDRLFAPPVLHHELQAAGMGPGVVLTLIRIQAQGNRQSWLVQPPNGFVSHNGDLAATAPAPSATTASAPSNGRPRAVRPNFADMELLMHHSLAASWRAWMAVGPDAHFTSEDVRGAGITLFLQCARSGVIPQTVEEGRRF
ncbi:MAG: hypothetical protein V1724_05150 [Chloroflexota bacterium]